MKFNKKLLYACAAAGLVALAGVTGLLIPHLSKHFNSAPIVFGDNVGKTLAHYWLFTFTSQAQQTPPDDELYLSTIFTPLQGKSIGIPLPQRSGNGGGLTSWDEDVLLITHEGKIYIIDKNLSISASLIEAPRNGFDDYVQASKLPPFDKAEHQFHRFRFNDISAFEFSGTRGLLVSYTRYDPERGCYNTTVSRLTVKTPDDDLKDFHANADDWTTVFETSPCLPLKLQWRAIEGHRAGGRLVYDRKHTVYLASGDYGWDGMFGPYNLRESNSGAQAAMAQDPEVDYGKIIAINLADGSARHISSGHRNPQGIDLDREGQVWVVEHGARGGDELNRVVEGSNFGWPLESLGTSYSVLPLPTTDSFGHHDQYTRPTFAWLPSIATSGLARIEQFHSTWNGDLLVSSLRGKQLARIRIADDRVIFSERIDIGHHVRYVHQHTDGRIVLWTDENLLIYLSPAEGGLAMKYVNYRLDVTINDPGLRRSTRIAINNCLECHSLVEGDHTNAPSLANIFGSDIGKTSYSSYSPDMAAEQRTWSRKILTAYLQNPAAVIPNTTMPNPYIGDEATLSEIVSILEGLATDVKIPFIYRD